jgi:hypothetical protein
LRNSDSFIINAEEVQLPLSKKDKNKTGLIIVIIVFLIVISVGKYFGEQRKESSKQGVVSLPTTYDTGRDGYKVLFLLFDRMGYDTGRFEKDIVHIGDSQKTNLVIIYPYSEHLKEGYAQKLHQWVENGNNLLVIDDGNSPLWELLGITCLKTDSIRNKQVQISENTGVLNNVNTIGPVGQWRFKIPEQEERFDIHLEDEQGVICVSKSIGKGKIILFSSPVTFTNNNIKENDNVILISNLVASMGGAKIYFDEFLHGYGRKDFSFSASAEAVFWQFGIVILLFYACFLVRFGKIRPLKGGNVRIATEYVHSLGNLFKKAQARSFVLKNLVRNLQRRTGSRTGISQEASIEKLAGLSDTFSEDFKGKIASFIEKSKKLKDEKNMSDSELLEMSRDIEYIINKINQQKLSGRPEGNKN